MYRFWLAAMSLWSQRVSREGADKKYYVTMVKRAGRTDRGVTGTDPGRGDPPGTGVPQREAKADYLRERLPRACDESPVIQPPHSLTVETERRAVLYLPDGRALVRPPIGFFTHKKEG